MASGDTIFTKVEPGTTRQRAHEICRNRGHLLVLEEFRPDSEVWTCAENSERERVVCIEYAQDIVSAIHTSWEVRHGSQ